MRIVLDLQGAQNESRFRGIGRYSLSLAHEVAKQATAHEVHVVLNARLPDSISSIRSVMSNVIPRDRIHVFDVPAPAAEHPPENRWRTRAAELVREHALAALNPDIIHVSSLFEGFADDVVGSVGASGLDVPTVVSLYDLIPLSDPESYLDGQAAQAWYARKLAFLKRADRLLAISEWSAAEARTLLRIPDKAITVVGAGVDDHFKRVPVDPQRDFWLSQTYGIERPFLLYAGAADPRKNLNRLLKALSLLPGRLGRAHTLVCVGKISDREQQGLVTLAADLGIKRQQLLFLGYVPDTDLALLYNYCVLFIFPSLHEGFGLPAAEAMACGAPVIGSNTTSIPEVIGYPEALFDPSDPADMARCVVRFLSSPAKAKALRDHGPEQAGRHTWSAAASRTIAAYEAVSRNRTEAAVCCTPSLGAWRTTLVHSVAPEVQETVEAIRAMLSATQQVICVRADQAHDDLHAHIPLGRPRSMESAAASDAILYVMGQPSEAATFTCLMNDWPGIILPPAPLADAKSAVPSTAELYRTEGLSAVLAMRENPAHRSESALGSLVHCAHPILIHSRPEIEKARIRYGPEVAGRMYLVPPLSVDPATSRQWDTLIKRLSTVHRPFGNSLLQAVGQLGEVHQPGDMVTLAKSIALNLPRPGRRQILIDVSTLAQVDARTGIQRVVRSILSELTAGGAEGWRIEAIRSQGQAYVYARNFASSFLGLPPECLPPDELVETYPGDIFLGLDLATQVVPGLEEWFRAQKVRGVEIAFVVYDLLPLLRPEWFPSALLPMFERWMATISRVADRIIGISRAVTEDVEAWYDARGLFPAAVRFDWFNLGGDLLASRPTVGLPREVAGVHKALAARPFLLSVGTLEPRKGYEQTMDAFDRLWADGLDVGLIIVGQAGWDTDALVSRLKRHPERSRRLFWLRNASDEMLSQIYARAAGLLAASEGEGFGLPLIEAAQHGLPILVRDLPVFREIAGDHAAYFHAATPIELAGTLAAWIAAWADGTHVRSDRLPWLTWKQSAAWLLEVLLQDHSANLDPAAPALPHDRFCQATRQ